MKNRDFLARVVAIIFMNVPYVLIVLYLSSKPAFDEMDCSVVLVTWISAFIPVVAYPRAWYFMIFPLLSHVFLAVAAVLCPLLICNCCFLIYCFSHCELPLDLVSFKHETFVGY